MFRIAVCDNEAEERAVAEAGVRDWLCAHPEVDGAVTAFSGAAALLTACGASAGEGAAFDLFLLDIIMPGMDGIEVGRRLRALGQNAAILYLTSSPDHALEAYGVAALRYLQKPLEKAALFDALDMAWLLYSARPRRTVMLNGKNGVYRVVVEDIATIENDAHNMTYQLKDGSRIVCGHRGLSFEEAAAPVVSGSRGFLQTHKSFFVNMAYIREIQPGSIVLDDGRQVPITRRRFTEIRSLYLDYISGSGVDGV